MASLVLGAVGYAAGGPLGYMVGSALGAFLFPPKGQDGPRLTDLKVQNSSYGSPIPIVYGRYRVSGNVIWATDLVEHKHEQDMGSGGGGATSYSYTDSFAVSICEGEHGLLRMWADGKLIWDNTGVKPVQNFTATSFTIYRGNEDQLPDPTMEAAKGVGNVPAYRGQMYVVFADLDLSMFGNRLPNLTFEVADIGEGVSSLLKFYPIADDLGTPFTDYSAWDSGLILNPTTKTLWQIVDRRFGYSYEATGSVALIDQDTMTIKGYTSGESGYAQYSTTSAVQTPPADQATADAQLLDQGARYFYIGAAANGVWAGHDQQLAQLVNGSWQYVVPTTGMKRWEPYAQNMYSFNGSSWVLTNEDPNSFEPFYLLFNPVANTVWAFSLNMLRVFNADSGALLFEKIYNNDPSISIIDTPAFSPGYTDLWMITADDLINGGDSKAIRKISQTNGDITDAFTYSQQLFSFVISNDGRLWLTVSGNLSGANDQFVVFDPATAVFTVLASYDFGGDTQHRPRWITYDSKRDHVIYFSEANNLGVDACLADIFFAETSSAIFNAVIASSPLTHCYYDAVRDLVWIGRGSSGAQTATLAALDPTTLQVVFESESVNPFFSGYIQTNNPENCVYAPIPDKNGIVRYCWGGGILKTITLGEVVALISARTSLTVEQIDVRQLTELIDGYCITNNMAARTAIEPLMTAYFFDAVESDGKVKFVKRGGTSVVTLITDNIAVD